MPTTSRHDSQRREAGAIARALVAVVAVALAILGAEFYALVEHGRPQRGPPAPETPAVAAPAPAPSPAPGAKATGYLDRPVEDTVVGPRFEAAGWALDPAGVAAVEVRIGGRRFPATIGLARTDVAQAHPGFPDSAHAGFAFTGDFSAELAGNPAPAQDVAIVVVARDGRETVLATRRLLVPAAKAPWSAWLDAHPRLAARKLAFLMLTSGVAAGGAEGIGDAYRAYLSRTTEVGMAVPILYLRTTRGAQGDWAFDPAFDLARKCGDRAVADDALDGVVAYSIAHRLPLRFVLNGGIWADAACDTPEWDLNDHLEADRANCQWTQNDEVFADDATSGLPGSTASPQLGRSLTYNVYATQVRRYKKRNLQAAAAIVARFARAHPELFLGVALDADTYMNPFVRHGRWYDYNPGMLKQFRHWLAGTGPYAGAGEPGTPDLSSYRRARPLALADVNRIARRHWTAWDDVDPPRSFAGEGGAAVPPGALPFWEDPWFVLWDSFRKHVVALHYDELAQWVAAAGVPRDRIYTAQAFIAPDAGRRPVSLAIEGGSPDYDSAGVSVAGAIPRAGHLGAILYGPAAQNRHPMSDGRSLFATFARRDPGWGIVEYNATDLKEPDVRPDYAATYRTLRELFDYDGRSIAMMAWNGSNGLYAGQPGYVAYTAWRNTPGEQALEDFLASHADLPAGARLWTFGSPRHPDDDGWRLADGTLVAGRGYADLVFAQSATLVSPPDQVLRAGTFDTLVIGLAGTDAPARIDVAARADGSTGFVAITGNDRSTALRRGPAGFEVPLAWPAAWSSRRTIATQLRIAITFAPGTRTARVERVALLPRE